MLFEKYIFFYLKVVSYRKCALSQKQNVAYCHTYARMARFSGNIQHLLNCHAFLFGEYIGSHVIVHTMWNCDRVQYCDIIYNVFHLCGIKDYVLDLMFHMHS